MQSATQHDLKFTKLIPQPDKICGKIEILMCVHSRNAIASLMRVSYRKSQCTFIISAGDRIPRVGCVIALIDNASVL
ncbi:hypothetical protein [Nostoc sp. UHCC 0251]|uniref:hypothetical protein n=1 Tax=Nostoc sp. UHCC 0251 TaxID=3110240 RepID=UPI002B1FAA6E|nr:hypothetical protein [Nostoc sp. UHCC 0251]MEA5624871.1 hypothetical protein [Nostoc sp. UHCC 0251]